MYYKIFSLLSILALTILLIPGCASSESSAIPTYESPPSYPVEIHLTISDAPLLEKSVRLTATFSIHKSYPVEKIDNITARIELPEGFKLVEGEPEWKGVLTKGTSAEIKVTLMSVKTGYWTLAGRAIEFSSTGEAQGETVGYGVLYTYITEDTAEVSENVIRYDKSDYENIYPTDTGKESPPSDSHEPITDENDATPEVVIPKTSSIFQ